MMTGPAVGDLGKTRKFKWFDNGDGTYWILDVPIFAEFNRTRFVNGKLKTTRFGADWLNSAIAESQRRYKEDRFLAPIHIGHNDPHQLIPRECAGGFLCTRLETTMYEGFPTLTLFAHLLVPKRIFLALKDWKYPYRSIEAFTPSEKIIDSLALLSSVRPAIQMAPLIPEEVLTASRIVGSTIFCFSKFLSKAEFVEIPATGVRVEPLATRFNRIREHFSKEIGMDDLEKLRAEKEKAAQMFKEAAEKLEAAEKEAEQKKEPVTAQDNPPAPSDDPASTPDASSVDMGQVLGLLEEALQRIEALEKTIQGGAPNSAMSFSKKDILAILDPMSSRIGQLEKQINLSTQQKVKETLKDTVGGEQAVKDISEKFSKNGDGDVLTVAELINRYSKKVTEPSIIPPGDIGKNPQKESDDFAVFASKYQSFPEAHAEVLRLGQQYDSNSVKNIPKANWVRALMRTSRYNNIKVDATN